MIERHQRVSHQGMDRTQWRLVTVSFNKDFMKTKQHQISTATRAVATYEISLPMIQF